MERGEREGREEGARRGKEVISNCFFFLNTFQLLHLYNLKRLMSCLKVGLNSFLSLDLLFQRSNVQVFPLIQTIQDSLVCVLEGGVVTMEMTTYLANDLHSHTQSTYNCS